MPADNGQLNFDSSEPVMIFDLVKDFADVLDAMPEAHPRRRILKLLDEAIRRDVHFIDRHPTTFFQCLWNTCWWYDCPEAAKHYEEPEGGWEQTPPWELNGEKLYRLLQNWKEQKEDSIPRFFWLSSRRPPELHLDSKQKAVCPGHLNGVALLTVSTDGRSFVSVSTTQSIRVWDAASGKELRRIDVRERLGHLACSHDGKYVAGVSAPHKTPPKIHRWDVQSGVELQCLDVPDAPGRQTESRAGSVECIALSSNGTQVAAAGKGGVLCVWNDTADNRSCRLTKHDHSFISLTFSPDGSQLVSVSKDARHGTVRVSDATTGAEVECFAVEPSLEFPVCFSHDGSLLAISTGRNLMICDTANWERYSLNLFRIAYIKSIAFSPEGSYIVCGCSNDTVNVVNLCDPLNIETLHGHSPSSEGVTAVAVFPDSRHIVSGGGDGAVRVWDLDASGRHYPVNNHEQPITTTSQFRHDEFFVSASTDKTARIWHAESGECAHTLTFESEEGDTDASRFKLFIPDDSRWSFHRCGTVGRKRGTRSSRSGRGAMLPFFGRILAAFSKIRKRQACSIIATAIGREVLIWDIARGKLITHLEGHAAPISTLAFSPDSRLIATGSEPFTHAAESSLRLWRTKDGKQLSCLGGPDDVVLSVAFSPDGRQIVSGSRDKTATTSTHTTVRVWNAVDGTEISCLRRVNATKVTFSPDGRWIIAGGFLWDAATGKSFFGPFEGYNVHRGVAVSPDGHWIGCSLEDATVGIWDAHSGKQVHRLKGLPHTVEYVTFSPDSCRLVAGCPTRRGWKMWDVNSGKCLETFPEVDVSTWSLTGSRSAQTAQAWCTLRAWPCGRTLETVLAQAGSGRPVAWFPHAVHLMSIDPTGNSWAFSTVNGNHLYIVHLEGDPPS